MAKYNCEICDYSTGRFVDLTRHKQSKKHKRIVDQISSKVSQQMLY